MSKDFIRYAIEFVPIALFFFFSLGMILAAGPIGRLDLFLAGALGISGTIYSIYIGVKNHLKSKTLSEEEREKARKRLIYLYSQDIIVVSAANKKPILILPFIVSLFLIVAVTIYIFRSKQLFEFITSFNLPFILELLIFLYTLSFIWISIYMVGYLITGEILQRMLSHAKRGFFVDMVINFFYAIPFIIILSLIWTILALVSSKNRPTSLSIDIGRALRSLTFVALYEAFKYYTYINLARFAFSDAYTGVASYEARELFNQSRRDLWQIFLRAGVLLFYPVFISMTLSFWNIRFHFMNEDILLIVFAVTLGLFMLLRLFSEQLATLFYYIKTHHPEVSFNKIGISVENMI